MYAALPDAEHGLVYFTGELDAASTGRIAELISRARASAPASITADMSQVTFLDSPALGALVQAWHDCAAVGTVLRIRAPQRAVQHVLDRTSTGHLLGDGSGPA
jgi:anti-sigma B factor antagonist